MGVPEHIFFPSLSSVELLSRVFSPTHFSLSSASSSVASRPPVSPLDYSSPCPVTTRFKLSIIVLSSSTSPTNLATSVHPLHLNTVLPFISARGGCTPRCRTVSKTATVATDQMPVGHRFLGHSFPSRRHRFDQPSCSCVVLIHLQKTFLSPAISPGEMS